MPQWFKSAETRKRERLERMYRYYQAELSKAVRSKDLKKQKEIIKEARDKYGLEVYKTKQARKAMAKDIAKRKRLTKEEYLREKAPQTVQRALDKNK